MSEQDGNVNDNDTPGEEVHPVPNVKKIRSYKPMPKDQLTRKGRSKPDGSVIPWSQIKLDFVTNPDVNVQWLARKYKIDKFKLYERAKEESWQEDRRMYLDKLIADTRQRCVELVSQKALANFSEMIDELAAVRKLALKRFVTSIENGEMQKVEELTRSTVEAPAGKKSNNRGAITRIVLHRIPQLDSKLAQVAIKVESEILSGVIGISRPDSGAEDDPIEIE